MKLKRFRVIFAPLLVSCLALSMSLAQRPELRRNSDLIRSVQQALTEKGYDPGPADGIMGPLTRAAVEAFQKASGLAVDGQLNDETLNALDVPIPVKTGDDRSDGGGAVGTVGRAGATAGKAVASAGETAGRTTAKAATTAGKATAKGSTVAGKETAKAATTAGKATADGATTAGKATADATTTAGKAVGSGVSKAASGTRDFLFGGNELKKEVERQLEQQAEIKLDDVDVKVDDGVVTLRFKRGTRAEFDRAIRVARGIEGVKDVVLVTP